MILSFTLITATKIINQHTWLFVLKTWVAEVKVVGVNNVELFDPVFLRTQFCLAFQIRQDGNQRPGREKSRPSMGFVKSPKTCNQSYK